jgi:beta-fructofuranosidase
MKTMCNTIALAALMAIPLCSCSSDETVAEQRDWNTATYFASTDEQMQTTFYKPYTGYGATPCPSTTRGQRLQSALSAGLPAQSGRYLPPHLGRKHQRCSKLHFYGRNHSMWRPQGARCRTRHGSTIYNEADQLYYTFYTGNKYMPTSSEAAQP